MATSNYLRFVRALAFASVPTSGCAAVVGPTSDGAVADVSADSATTADAGSDSCPPTVPINGASCTQPGLNCGGYITPCTGSRPVNCVCNTPPLGMATWMCSAVCRTGPLDPPDLAA